jgi:hypothetical protein
MEGKSAHHSCFPQAGLPVRLEQFIANYGFEKLSLDKHFLKCLSQELLCSGLPSGILRSKFETNCRIALMAQGPLYEPG